MKELIENYLTLKATADNAKKAMEKAKNELLKAMNGAEDMTADGYHITNKIAIYKVIDTELLKENGLYNQYLKETARATGLKIKEV